MTAPTVIPFRHGPFWNFSYLVACEETREAAVIDPAWDVDAIRREAAAQGLAIRTLLLTHAHSDHANGVAELAAATGASVFVHAQETASLREHFSGPVEDFEHAGQLAVGHIAIRVHLTPGHTPGSVCFEADGRLFTGDTLNIGAVGSPGHEAGASEAMWNTVRGPLACLPAELVVHPGHDVGPVSCATLAEIRERVPALRAESFEDFVSALERESGRRFGR